MFEKNKGYSRADIYRILDVPLDKQKGNWETGYHFYEDILRRLTLISINFKEV